VLEQELGGLEALGQVLPERLLDHARPGEADHRAGLREDQVAEHRVAALTPPVVGFVSSETYGMPRSASCDSTADALAICMSDSTPSCMRAPPER
jgi:hypothetical protein